MRRRVILRIILLFTLADFLFILVSSSAFIISQSDPYFSMQNMCRQLQRYNSLFKWLTIPAVSDTSIFSTWKKKSNLWYWFCKSISILTLKLTSKPLSLFIQTPATASLRLNVSEHCNCNINVSNPTHVLLVQITFHDVKVCLSRRVKLLSIFRGKGWRQEREMSYNTAFMNM